MYLPLTSSKTTPNNHSSTNQINCVNLSFNDSDEYVNITCSSPLALPLSDVNHETPLNQLSFANPVNLSFNDSNECVNITCSSPLALPLSDVNRETPTMLLNSVKTSSAVLLKTIGMKRLKEMTLRKRLLYSVTKKLKKQINIIKRKNVTVKQQHITSKKFVAGDSCNHLVDRVSETTLKFFHLDKNSK